LAAVAASLQEDELLLDEAEITTTVERLTALPKDSPANNVCLGVFDL